MIASNKIIHTILFLLGTITFTSENVHKIITVAAIKFISLNYLGFTMQKLEEYRYYCMLYAAV